MARPRDHDAGINAVMSVAKRIAPTLLACALAGPGFAGAATAAVSPAEAEATQGQLRAWIAGLLGTDPGDRAVRVAPDGEGARFDWPLAGPLGDSGATVTAPAPATVLARPLDGGRWAIESLRLPSPLRLDAPDAAGGARRWTLTVGDQDVHALLDPTLATPSSFDATLRDPTLDLTAPGRTRSVHLDRKVVHGTWEPVGDGRITVQGEARGENLTVTTGGRDPSDRVTVAAARLHSAGVIDRLAPDRLATVIRSLSGLLPAALARGGAAPADLTPEDRARLRALVVAARDLLGGAQQETTLEQVRLDAGGQGGTLAKLTIGSKAVAADGKLDAALRLVLDGIDTPLVPPGPLRDYLPRHLTFAPRISGLPLDALMRLLLRGIDGDQPETLQADAGTLLETSPVQVAIDDFVLDLGPATIKATGATTVIRPDQLAGTATISATGLDALIRRANAVPELRLAAPVLIFLKGLGEPRGEATWWTVAYADGRATVNGADLSALMPPAAPPGRPRDRVR